MAGASDKDTKEEGEVAMMMTSDEEDDHSDLSSDGEDSDYEDMTGDDEWDSDDSDEFSEGDASPIEDDELIEVGLLRVT